MSSGGGLAVVDTEAGWDSSRHSKDDLQDAMVVESRQNASFKPINPAAARPPTPEPEASDDEPLVVAPAPFAGGLRTAAQLAEETAKRKRHEERLRRKALKETAGKEEETVYRDSTGKARDTKKEKVEARRQERDDMDKQMAKMEWGKGLVQREDKERRKREEEAMAAKPVARYADDEELNDQQKSEMRWNDPAARFLTVRGRPSAALRIPMNLFTESCWFFQQTKSTRLPRASSAS